MTGRVLVAGVDSSSQATKVMVCDAETGQVLREGARATPTAPRSTRSTGGAPSVRRSPATSSTASRSPEDGPPAWAVGVDGTREPSDQHGADVRATYRDLRDSVHG